MQTGVSTDSALCSLKEELWRRQKVATTFVTHPVGALEEGKADVGSIELATAVFHEAERLDILNRVVLWQRAKKRVMARPAKTRAMVQGGGKKPWRQKGSGRARHGSIRSPIWKGGGKAHGPVPRSFAFDLPKKVRRLALRVALSARMREGKLVVIESEEIAEPKTAYLDSILRKWGWDNLLVPRTRCRCPLCVEARRVCAHDCAGSWQGPGCSLSAPGYLLP